MSRAFQMMRVGVFALFAVPAVERLGRPQVLKLAKLLDKVANKLYALYRKAPQARQQLDVALAGQWSRPKADFEGRLRLTARYYLGLGQSVRDLALRPKMSILLPIYKVEPRFLAEALMSVERQVYPDWELCAVDDASGDPRLAAMLEDFAKRHPGKVKFAQNATNGHISITSNRCLELATGEFTVLLDHDDRLYPHALAEIVRHLNLLGEPDVMYSDERMVDATGAPSGDPFHKPTWSPFLHLCMNYTTHLSCYRTALIREIGGFRTGFEGSQDHDLMLRAVEATKKPVGHVPFCLYQWRSHPASTAGNLENSVKPYAAAAGEKAVSEALARRGRPAKVAYVPATGHYRVTFAVQEPHPLVSIVIPSKDAPQLIRRCLESVVQLSTYENYEIVISDNGSSNPETLALYAEMKQKLGDSFRAHIEPGPFNFGLQVNKGVALARGPYVLLLNNDTEVITPEWIEEMLGLAQFPEVGAVGCKLLFADRRIQHAGVFLSAPKIAEHAGILCPEDDRRYWNMLGSMHEISAVTAACLLVSKAKYEEMGGLDAVYLPRGFGDVDFCLKLRERGLVNVYTPYAKLFHHESATRGVSIEYFECHYMRRVWGQQLATDPYRNPNLIDGPRYEVDGLSVDLDLSAAEFDFFLKTPPERWIEATA